MAYKTPQIRGQKEVPVDIILDKFDGGTVTQISESRISNKMARESVNLMQDQDGLWTKRWGTGAYGEELSTSFDGWYVAVKDDGDGTTTQQLIVIDGGTPKKSTDGGSWSTISGATFTAGKRMRMAQLGSRVYMSNATDDLAYYDIDAGTMTTYSGLDAVAAPTIARSILTTGDQKNFYRVSAVNDVGETVATATTAGDGDSGASYTTDKHRDSWALDGTEYLTLSWTAVTTPDATGYNIYWSDTQGYEMFIGSSSTNEFVDDGTNAPNSFIEYPVADTTTGPTLGQLAVSVNRLWGTLDPNNPWRVYGTGTGNQLGAFSPYFGGFWVDLDLGGPERPTAVKDFRDGRGTTMTAAYTKNPQGGGSTWLIELIAATVGSGTIIIPKVFKVIGSNGTPAPDSLVLARDKLHAFSRTSGFVSLGSKTSLLNVLATEEESVLIRPTVRSIKESAQDGVTGHFYDGRTLWSVPFNSETNNQTWVMDMEHKNWALPWTIGFNGFVEYTDSDGDTKLLGIPADGGLSFLGISSNYQGDSGTAFATKYSTGTIHFDKSHTSFAWINKIHVILGSPQGKITVNVIGTQRNKPSAAVATKEIEENTSTNSGISTDEISTVQLSDTENSPDAFATATVKKTVKVNKLLNNIKIQVSSSELATDYTILRIVIEGRLVPINEPSSWRS